MGYSDIEPPAASMAALAPAVTPIPLSAKAAVTSPLKNTLADEALTGTKLCSLRTARSIMAETDASRFSSEVRS